MSCLADGRFNDLGLEIAQERDPVRTIRSAPGSLIREVPSPQSGFLEQIDAREIGLAAAGLGAGRSKKGDRIDHAVGILVHHKVGDRIEAGEALFTVHANDPVKLEEAAARVSAAHRWSSAPVARLPLFYKTLNAPKP
jgi:pyrimidine-nucleoside phosphorylase